MTVLPSDSTLEGDDAPLTSWRRFWSAFKVWLRDDGIPKSCPHNASAECGECYLERTAI